MFSYYLHKLLCGKTININLSSRNELVENDTLLFINNFRFHKIHCVNLIRQIAHCLQQSYRMKVDKDVCIVDYNLHRSYKIELAFYRFH